MRDKRSWSHTRSLALARAAEKEEGSFGFIREMVFLSAFLCDSVRDKVFRVLVLQPKGFYSLCPL